MSMLVEVLIPSCDVEIMDWLTMMTGMERPAVLSAAIVLGLLGLCARNQTITPDDMCQWCESTHRIVGDRLSEIE